MSDNSNLHKAKAAKNDEFYTRYEDIEAEVQHYKEHLRGQIVYCPCDDYRESNFVKFFKDHFEEYGLKELWATNYDIGKGSYYYRYDGEEHITPIENGGFRSNTEIMKKADMIITNPPFSLFRDFIDWLNYDEAV